MSIPDERTISVWHPRLLRAALWVSVPVLLAAAVSTASRSWWIADLVANLRVQLILGLIAALVTSVVARNWKLASMSGVVLLWQASWLWSPVFRDFLVAADLYDASRGHGLTPTWYRWPLFPFGLVLDHGLASQDLLCRKRSILGDVGSDHRPLTLEFRAAAQ